MEVRGGVSRLAVLEGPTGRRLWSEDVKARIVAESFLRGRRVCDLAARYGVAARHLSSWRSLARRDLLALPAEQEPSFVPRLLEPPEPKGGDCRRRAAICGSIFPGSCCMCRRPVRRIRRPRSRRH
jgi:transposase